MKAHRRNKLIAIIGGLLLLSGAVALILYALSSNINHFYPPTEVSQGKAPLNKTIRVGGLVAYNSVKRAADGLDVEFTVTDNQNSLRVQYHGILPDLFKEGQGVIAEGQLVSKTEFVASKVLAKHDEKYMPPEVEQSLEKYGHPGKKQSTDY
ncbi:cytochrome c maturation protein CcmE [Kangiella geojedonensis]|uniref:Cytochrome c-type biogenesis protein CcmE n=1 Tax=Kangiella geojedonensis TaxID=914150 RepID=A0A0F6TPS4_9GAMM|nr:cytochrome c maturation protein CcmE [Kangiella geojedonensis]AKE51779.1 cytochrome C biogenesis protein CcmC [Kangiella geojedonensis]